MTRTQKWTYHEKKAEPHMFTHNGHPDQNPQHTKKNGAGRGNWGSPGDEINDLIDDGEINPVFNKRRGSNSSGNEVKFDAIQHNYDHIDEDDEDDEDDQLDEGDEMNEMNEESDETK